MFHNKENSVDFSVGSRTFENSMGILIMKIATSKESQYLSRTLDK